MKHLIRFSLILTLMNAPSAQAEDKERSPLLRALASCRTVSEDNARLACFDQSVLQLDEAEKRGDVIIADRAEVRENRRSLFGFSLPSLSLFKRGGKEEPEIMDIETTLKSASQSGYKWTFLLANGARWRQIDGRTLINPRPGAKIVIRRTTMGGYLLKIGSDTAVRAARIE